MRPGDAPENWQKRGRDKPEDAPPPKVSVVGQVLLFLAFLAFVGAAIAGYVVLGRDSSLQGTLPLPKPLQTASRAHEDLLLYGRELNELAVDAAGRLQAQSKQNFPVVTRMLDRLDRLHKAGQDLVPRLTVQETHAFTDWQKGEKLLGDFIESAANKNLPFDLTQLQRARAQFAAAQNLATGHKLGKLVRDDAKGLREAGARLAAPLEQE